MAASLRIYSGSAGLGSGRLQSSIVSLSKHSKLSSALSTMTEGLLEEVGGAHSAETRTGATQYSEANRHQKAVPCSEKKNLNMPATGPPACVDLLNFCHHTNTGLNQTSHFSTSSPLNHAHQPLLSPLASADTRIPSRHISNYYHPVSIRQTQWPEARASHLEGRAPAVRRAPRDPRSSRATRPELDFR